VLHQWVCWAYEYQPERNPQKPWSKIPKCPSTGCNASSTNPRTWGTLVQALARYRNQQLDVDGVGFVLADDDPYAAVDLDDCRDSETGEIQPWAMEIIRRFASYTEVSPSGTGIRVFVKGRLPPKGRKKGNIEVYDNQRFMTVTGCRLADTPATIEERQRELETWHHELFGEPHTTPIGHAQAAVNGHGWPLPLPDDALLEKARATSNGAKFAQLWDGDITGYPSHSEADAALCALMAFWTRDVAQVDRLFQRSGLMRDKWNEQHGADTYGNMTIQHALGLVKNHHSGNGHKPTAATGIIPSQGTLPWINASNTNLPVIAAQAWQALLAANAPPHVFVQGRRLVRLERENDGALIMVDLSRERLRHELARVAIWYKLGKTEDDAEIVLPPMWLVDDMLARPEPPLPALSRITETPAFAPDGTLQTNPGYHAAGRAFYDPPAGLTIPEVPECPSSDDVEIAKKLIAELFHDFPFVDDADRAHAIALQLLPYVRDLIPGPTPNHLIESPGPGSGKGLLADVALRPAAGSQIGIVTEAKDEDEWRKRLTSRLKEARAVLLLDNIRRPLDSAQLAGALTALVWEDRLLGVNETIRVPVRCVWVTTGNNPSLSTEMARRSIRIRLDPKIDRPWLREEFLHTDLRTWADENRARPIWAALVLVQNWLAKGRPSTAMKPLGSYEQWSAVIGDILQAAEIPGFLANLDEFYEIADHEGATWRAFVTTWWGTFGDREVGASELFSVASAIEGFDLGTGTERAQRTTFGRQLGKQRDRVIAGYRVVLAGTAQRAKRWKLFPTEPSKSEHRERS
jgi:hypothetical protein